MKTRFSIVRVASLALLLTITSQAARAVPNPIQCTVTLIRCYDEASNLGTFLLRTAAGLDCAINYAACIYRQFGH